MRTAHAPLRVAWLAAILALAAAAPASAGVATVSAGKLVYTGTGDGDQVLLGYLAGGGGSWQLTGYGTTITAQDGCSGGPTVVTCPAGAVTQGVRVVLGDGVNGFDVDRDHPVPAGTAVEVTGGSGEDAVLGTEGDDTIDTGAGDDYVEIGPGTDVVVTGDGKDQVLDHGGTGPDTVHLGAHDDLLAVSSLSADGADAYDGGPGRDRVSYASRTTPVVADLSGSAPGLTPEDALTALEDATGAAHAASTLVGNDAKNTLVGGSEADTLDAGGSDDYLQGTAETTSSSAAPGGTSSSPARGTTTSTRATASPSPSSPATKATTRRSSTNSTRRTPGASPPPSS